MGGASPADPQGPTVREASGSASRTPKRRGISRETRETGECIGTWGTPSRTPQLGRCPLTANLAGGGDEMYTQVARPSMSDCMDAQGQPAADKAALGRPQGPGGAGRSVGYSDMKLSSKGFHITKGRPNFEQARGRV